MALHRSIESLIHGLRYRKAAPWIHRCTSAADLGCGTEYRFIKRVRDRAHRWWGLDITVHDADDGNVHLRTADIMKTLPFADGALDQIVMLAVLEHLADPRAVFTECYRVLVPGGRLVVTTPSRLGIHVHEIIRRCGLVRDVEEGEHHDFRMSTAVLEQWANAAGFRIVHVARFELGMNLLLVAEKA